MVKYPTGVFAAVSRVGKKDDAPTGGPLNPAFDYVWGAVVGDVQQDLLEGGGADADAPEAVQLALLDALELGDEEYGGDEE